MNEIMAKQWDYFHRTTDRQEHMSVLVDAAYAKTAPLGGYTRLVSIVINLYAIATDKGERNAAQSKLGVLERQLENRFAERWNAVYIGRINTDTRLEFYYYAADTGEELQQQAEQAMAAYPNYRWVASEREDADWSFYRYLRPNDIEKLYVKNNVLIQSLSEKGDRLGLARDVYHWLRFRNGDDMRKAADNAKRLGYVVVNAEVDGERPAYPHTLIISKHHPLALGAMNDYVTELYDLAKSFAGLYDGWGADIRQRLWRKLKDGLGKKRLFTATAALLLGVLAVLLAVPLVWGD